ncbi:1,2-phenylacetyl-CoA epoxidase subunit PaaD [Gordonia sp. CPCC 205515]|uniref:1,2-phenylacetyl-CoA epoxidase subunit PaaD n=1 Tax=Gordonia sp. CPCC 205515 TaxID=3140791 RepID=UPI003AF3DB1A
MVTAAMIDQAEATRIVGSVPDPEMPFLSLTDLGVVRDVAVEGTSVVVTITPTYAGCPAMKTIRDDIERTLADHGAADVRIETRLQPAWSTDWISDAGRAALAAQGYSTPGSAPSMPAGPIPLTLIPRPRQLQCPRCGSAQITQISEFGATLCKAAYQCRDCREPFEHIKEI